MTKTNRPAALQGERAGEFVFRETPPNSALPLAAQTETMTTYQLDRWLTVSPKWEGRHHG